MTIPNNGRLQVNLPPFVWEYLERERVRTGATNIPQVVRTVLTTQANNERARDDFLSNLGSISADTIDRIAKLADILDSKN